MSYEDVARELLKAAEPLAGERWYAMAPPWSGQFVLSGDEDPHAGRFVCCTDPTLHMDGEDLQDYEDDVPGERAEFIARCDPTTVMDLAKAVLELAPLQPEIEALHIALEASGNRREAHEAKVIEQQEEIERLQEELKQATYVAQAKRC